MGSNGIMLRSVAKKGLVCSSKVGSGFHDNGDFFGLCYNGKQVTDVVGWGNHLDSALSRAGVKPGPAILSQMLHQDSDLDQRYQFQDMCFPGAYSDVMAVLFQTVRNTTDTDPADQVPQLIRALRDLGGILPNGALNSTMFYLCMGHRNKAIAPGLGQIVLDPSNAPTVKWPTPGAAPIFNTMNDEVLKHAKAQGAIFLPLNMWQFSPYQSLVTAHPLGGCSMANSGSDGVVDHQGRVFTGDSKDVHEDLFITDGSTVPRTLGCNPLLTLTALAERFSELHRC
jgi:cholesterol oxidase